MAIHLTSITSTFFINLLNRLGCKPPPPEGFDLINTVQPVSIVDSDISLPIVATTIPIDTVFTNGEIASPAANVVLADTGALIGGNYNALVMVGGDQAAAWGFDFRLQRRDAANAVSIWSQVFQLTNNNEGFLVLPFTFRAQVNERLRVITANAATAGTTVQASIWLQQVS